MKIRKFFHIAIEVPNLDKAIDFYTKSLDLTLISRHKLADKKLEVAFVGGEGCEIELMCYESCKDKNYVEEEHSRFHHLAFEVDDINEAMNELSKKGIVFDSAEAIPVFGGKIYYNTFRGPANELLEIAEIKQKEKEL